MEKNDDEEKLMDFLAEAELLQYYQLFRDVLKITKLSQLVDVQCDDLNEIGLSKPEQRRYKKIYSKHFPNTYITRLKKIWVSSKAPNQNLQRRHSLPMAFQTNSDSNGPNVPIKHVIKLEHIEIFNEIGAGQFGVVQQGIWKKGNQRIQVAIKCLGNKHRTSSQTEFMKEAAVMHSIDHPNIVRLFGVVVHGTKLMLVTELAPLRSLLNCLTDVNLREKISVLNLCQYAEQICDGMCYLERKRLIHRDLAARNILVFSKDKVKIADFGLSRALGVDKDYYQIDINDDVKLPVAWCAPECIAYRRFTSASDVWAFAVCLWEMFMYGAEPWASLLGKSIMEAIDSPNGQRLGRPECCPEAYYTTMLECWSHDPKDRPNFMYLRQRLQNARPEVVQATADYIERNNVSVKPLEHKQGDLIVVLEKERSDVWFGIRLDGAVGYFDSTLTKPHSSSQLKSVTTDSHSPHTRRSLSRPFLRPSLSLSDTTRHTFSGKRTIKRCMISSPQGDVKHTGHIGLDGTHFGDISFLDAAVCVPSQMLFKEREDSEEVPLINPNLPSHLKGPPCTSSNSLPRKGSPGFEDDIKVNSPRAESKGRSSKKASNKLHSEPTTSKGLLSKVRSATLLRSHKSDKKNQANTLKQDEVHEYYEISDNEMGTGVDEEAGVQRADSLQLRGSGDINECAGDTQLRYRSNHKTKDSEAGATLHVEAGNEFRASTLNKQEKKKVYNSDTMKTMSAHEEKTLDTAVAMANEITTRSMTDLDGTSTQSHSPLGHSKFHFKFPSGRGHASLHPESDKESTAKHERRNFSEEANSVPDIQESLTEESKKAYLSLIEEPTPPSTLISHMAKDVKDLNKTSTLPLPMPTSKYFMPANNFLPMHLSYKSAALLSGALDDDEISDALMQNGVVPLPPRTSTAILVDKPRHVRKYPLKLVNDAVKTEQVDTTEAKGHKVNNAQVNTTHVNGQLTLDSPIKVQTNPFKNIDSQTSSNPFNMYLEPLDCEAIETNSNADEQFFLGRSLAKDHVSVEDLLSFADQKPCGRELGVESDEVRVLVKILKQVTPNECMEALELCGWCIHKALKVMNVKIAIGDSICLADCFSQLSVAKGDIDKAIKSLSIPRTNVI